MAQYLVRQCCEYSKLIEADSEEESIDKFMKLGEEDLDKSYSQFEAEEYQPAGA